MQVHGGIRHLEIRKQKDTHAPESSWRHMPFRKQHLHQQPLKQVHGGIRHLEMLHAQLVGACHVHGGIRHLEM